MQLRGAMGDLASLQVPVLTRTQSQFLVDLPRARRCSLPSKVLRTAPPTFRAGGLRHLFHKMRPQALHVLSWPTTTLLIFAASARLSVASYDTSNATVLADSEVLNDPFPYYFPQLNATAAQKFAMPLCYGVKIEEATIDQLQSYMANGTLTGVQLLDCYLQRVHQTDEYIK